MFIALLGVKLYADCYTCSEAFAHSCTWSEALCSYRYMECSFMPIAIHVVKLYNQCYTWSDAMCSLLFME